MVLKLQNRFQILADNQTMGECNDFIRPPDGAKATETLSIPFDKHLAKTYFKLLQAIHHSEILANAISVDSCPPGMLRQVDKLTAFIRPSSPSEATTNRVKLNTAHWMETNMAILREHYDMVIAAGLENTPKFNLESFNAAVYWSKARYKRKYTTSSAETLKSMLLKITPLTGTEAVPDTLSPEDFPPLTACPSPPPPVAMGDTDTVESTQNRETNIIATPIATPTAAQYSNRDVQLPQRQTRPKLLTVSAEVTTFDPSIQPTASPVEKTKDQTETLHHTRYSRGGQTFWLRGHMDF